MVCISSCHRIHCCRQICAAICLFFLVTTFICMHRTAQGVHLTHTSPPLSSSLPIYPNLLLANPVGTLKHFTIFSSCSHYSFPFLPTPFPVEEYVMWRDIAKCIFVTLLCQWRTKGSRQGWRICIRVESCHEQVSSPRTCTLWSGVW